MLINERILTSSDKLRFLVLEQWSGEEFYSGYDQQAQILRRALDSVEHFEKIFTEQEIVGFAYKGISYQCVFSVVCVDDLDQLDAYIVDNAPHVRVGSDCRQVWPLVDWTTGRDRLHGVLRRLEELADGEQAAD